MIFAIFYIGVLATVYLGDKQARKSSEDGQATGYAQFEKVWAG